MLLEKKTKKRYSLGITLLEVVMIMIIGASLFDIIKLGLMKSNELNIDKQRSVYLLTLKSYIQKYVQSISRSDFCQIKTGRKNTCSDIKTVELKKIISDSQYYNLPEKERENTYILLKNESVGSSSSLDPINYLSALAFVLPDDKNGSIDVQRSAALAGPEAGMYDKDSAMISNGSGTYSFLRSDWVTSKNKTANKINEKASILYLPSGLNEIIPLKIGKVQLSNVSLVKDEAGVSSACPNKGVCSWKGRYISDKLKISWKPSKSTDYVQVKMTEDNNPNMVWYSAQLFNTNFISFPADKLWYNNNRKTITITPYSLSSTASKGGPSVKYNLKIDAPVSAKSDSEAKQLLPFNINLKLKVFTVDGNNKYKQNSDDKLIIPESLNINLKRAINNQKDFSEPKNIIYTFVKPVVIKFAFSIHYKDTTNNKELTRIVDMHTFSVKDANISQYLSDQEGIDSLLNSPDRTAIKLDKNTIEITPTIQVYWGFKKLFSKEVSFNKINYSQLKNGDSIDLIF